MIVGPAARNPGFWYSNLHLPPVRREEHPKATSQGLYVSPERGQPHVRATFELGDPPHHPSDAVRIECRTSISVLNTRLRASTSEELK